MKLLVTRTIAVVERLVRYGAVGVGTTLFYSLLTMGLIASRAITKSVFASLLAGLATQPLAFIAHRRFSYGDVPEQRGQVGRFVPVAISSVVFGTLSVGLANAVGWPVWTGLAIGWFVVPVANYVVMTLWVFRGARLLRMGEPTEAKQPPSHQKPN